MKKITEITPQTSWPHWLPKGNRRLVELTSEQLNYILPVFNSPPRSSSLDGVTLCDGRVSGNRIAFASFLRRFAYSDIDISNLVEASQPTWGPSKGMKQT
jgi:hypothetical protein